MCCHCRSSSHFAPVMQVHTHIFVCQIYLSSLMDLHWNMTLEVLSTIAGVLPGHVLGSSICSCCSTCSPMCHLHHNRCQAYHDQKQVCIAVLQAVCSFVSILALCMALLSPRAICPLHAVSSASCLLFSCLQVFLVWLLVLFWLEKIQEPNEKHPRMGEEEAGR